MIGDCDLNSNEERIRNILCQVNEIGETKQKNLRFKSLIRRRCEDELLVAKFGILLKKKSIKVDVAIDVIGRLIMVFF